MQQDNMLEIYKPLTQIALITCIIKKGKESHLFAYVFRVLSNSSIFLLIMAVSLPGKWWP